MKCAPLSSPSISFYANLNIWNIFSGLSGLRFCTKSYKTNIVLVWWDSEVALSYKFLLAQASDVHFCPFARIPLFWITACAVGYWLLDIAFTYCFYFVPPPPSHVSHPTANLVHLLECHYKNVKGSLCPVRLVKIMCHYANRNLNALYLRRIYAGVVQCRWLHDYSLCHGYCMHECRKIFQSRSAQYHCIYTMVICLNTWFVSSTKTWLSYY